TPIGSSNSLFFGFIVSEGLIVIIQLLLTYIIVFGFLHTYYANILGLILSFLMYLVYSFTCIGLGLIFASLLNAKLAGQLPLIIIMPFIFLSGTIVPLNSNITYLIPLFWVHQFSVQVSFFGVTDLFQNIQLVSFMSNSVTEINFPLILCIPIALLTSLFFMLTGIIIYHRKTQ
ncbi:MAG: ABC transporter permease, partial [Candidatus Thorarchaeota archaeon]